MERRVFIVSIEPSTGEITYNIDMNSNQIFIAFVANDSNITIDNENATLNDLPKFVTPAEITLDENNKNIITSINITRNN